MGNFLLDELFQKIEEMIVYTSGTEILTTTTYYRTYRYGTVE